MIKCFHSARNRAGTRKEDVMYTEHKQKIKDLLEKLEQLKEYL